MSGTDHKHEWVWSGDRDCRCACGADMWAIQTMLGEAAADARRVAGDAHYTGCWVRQELEKLELWMCDAPSLVLQELDAMHPGVYLIHNDAPRTHTALLELMDALPVDRLKAEGIHVVRVGPTYDGYLHVGVMGDVPTAQARLDSMLGSNVAHVEYGEPIAVGFAG